MAARIYEISLRVLKNIFVDEYYLKREEISYLQATMYFYYMTLIFIPLSMLLLSLVNLIEEWH